MTAFVVCLLCSTLSQCQTAPSQKQAPTKVIRCGSLFDGISVGLQKDKVIRVQANRIVAIANFQPGPGASAGLDVLDYSAETCLPGLIDVHVHVIEQDPMRRETKGAAAQSLSASALERTLGYGFTTVRNLGTTTLGPSDIDVRNAVEAGLLAGPRMQIAMMNTTTRNFGVKGEPMLRETVDKLAAAGSQWIKIFASPGWDYAPEYDATELAAIVDEAHKKGLKVAMHTVGAEDSHSAVQAHVDSIEHGVDIADADLALMRERGIVYVPTLSVLQFASALPDQKDPAMWTYQLKRNYSTFDRALKAKVKIAFGTDAGALDGGYSANPAPQLGMMVQHGMSPREAILSSIREGAELMDMKNNIGSIEVGKLADIIAVRGDPLTDISVLEHVDFVMKDGRTFKSNNNAQAPHASR